MPRDRRILLGLVAVVAAAYLNSFQGVFQFDDYRAIVFNPVVHSLGAWREDLGHGIRPLLKLSYAMNWVLDPGELGFHLLNLALHLGNTMLVCVFARLLAPDRGPAAAVLAALLFGLHPAQTEAVTYISGRSLSLMTFFYLSAVTAYVAGSLRRRPWLVHVASPALFCMALATKEVAVTLPLALLLWEAARRDAPFRWREVARRQCVHWGVLGVAAVALLLHPVYGTRVLPELDPQALYHHLLSEVGAVGYLVLRFVRIWSLNIDPDLPQLTAWSPALAAQAAFLAGALGWSVWALRRGPWWWAFGVLWFFIHLLPTNSLVPREELANDRHLYLACVGLFFAAGVEVQRLEAALAARAMAIRAGAAVAVALLAAATIARNADYSSEIRLWEQTVRVSPRNPRVYNNLGFAYSAAGCLRKAENAYREAVRLDPRYEVALGNLEIVLVRANAASAAAPAKSAECP
jgi:protein O-mannosyl-transferase